ncbi:hypothetical protein EDE15_1060 [Edaphobacter aggregans]|uniref:Uncharacterized protein n=1 Tax=Edaphobacter aggregans TaxID=570835 RepID=A0A428MFQ5_9BACT|nr:hypothetical protein [Edaphobacter aggregans]RSL15569.1 hypothetical protein EDE15_1060 [Edaphobacter aggregans]
MPTPRKTIQELMLSGTYQQNKGRYKARIEAEMAAQAAQSAKPPTAAIGRAPAHLTADEKKVWAEIVKQSPALSHSDRLLVEVAVKLTVKLRTDGLKSAEMTKLISLLEAFKGGVADGINTPASSPNPKPDSDTRTEEEKRWDEFEQEMRELDEHFHERWPHTHPKPE